MCLYNFPRELSLQILCPLKNKHILIAFIYRAILDLQKIECRDLPHYLSFICTPYPTINIQHKSGTLVIINEPAMKHYYHSKSTALSAF